MNILIHVLVPIACLKPTFWYQPVCMALNVKQFEIYELLYELYNYEKFGAIIKFHVLALLLQSHREKHTGKTS